MNWRRALFRVWLVVSVLWELLLVGAVIYSYSINTVTHLIVVLVAATVPPALFYACYRLLAWILEGLNKK